MAEEDRRDDFEHIPYGSAWTETERAKFAMTAKRCPMCDYKFRYAELQRHVSMMQDMENAGIEDDDPRMLAMGNMVAQLSSEALEIGLLIASEQCASNALMVKALIQ